MHKGHRARMREKVKASCAEKHELLETLLYPMISQKNTNGIAHDLLDTFGSFNGILSAGEANLTKIDGVGKLTAFNIDLISQIFRQTMIEMCDISNIGTNEFERYRYIVALFFGYSVEKNYMLMFSSTDRFLGSVEIGNGNYWDCRINARDAIIIAKKKRAKKVILAHNHPDGILIPSDTDINASVFLTSAFGNADVTVISHVLVADNKYIDFSDKVIL